MKISLVNATFYFNPPINLTPLARELTINLSDLEDSVVRKLNLAYATGVVTITEGEKEFKERLAQVLKPKTAVAVPVTKEVEKVEEPKPVEVKEDAPKEEVVPVKATPTKKATTTAKKTATK